MNFPKHPKNVPKYLKDLLGLGWLLNHTQEMSGRAQGQVQNCASDFSRQSEQQSTCVQGFPGILR